jgi:hypothetical protein
MHRCSGVRLQQSVGDLASLTSRKAAKCGLLERFNVSLLIQLLIYCRDGDYKEVKHATRSNEDVTLRRWASSYQRFERPCCLHFQCPAVQEDRCQTTRLHIPNFVQIPAVDGTLKFITVFTTVPEPREFSPYAQPLPSQQPLPH